MHSALNYVQLFKDHTRLTTFGILMAFGSSFGQTFFVSLFNPNFMETFDLSEGELGFYYSLATLCSGLFFIWAGARIDHVPLRKFSSIVCVLGALACLNMLWIDTVWMLCLSFFLIRLTGQGLFSHIAMTSMAKNFFSSRGKALSLATMGFPLGEAIFPLIAVTSIAMFGWRQTWGLLAVAVFFVFLPVIRILLASNCEPEAKDEHLESSTSAKDWTRSQVLRDFRFYMLIPAVSSAPMILTGLFFYQANLGELKGWSLVYIAKAFPVFAVFHILGALLSGPSIDKFGALKHMPVLTITLLLCLITLQFNFDPALIYPYLAFAGVSAGISRTAASAVWAQIYGTQFLGQIKAMAGAIILVSTSLTPVVFGLILDTGYDMLDIAYMLSFYICACLIMTLFAQKR